MQAIKALQQKTKVSYWDTFHHFRNEHVDLSIQISLKERVTIVYLLDKHPFWETKDITRRTIVKSTTGENLYASGESFRFSNMTRRD